MSLLVDSHCHLDFPDFDNERDAIIERALTAGIGCMVTISTRVAKFDAVRAIAAYLQAALRTEHLCKQ